MVHEKRAQPTAIKMNECQWLGEVLLLNQFRDNLFSILMGALKFRWVAG